MPPRFIYAGSVKRKKRYRVPSSSRKKRKTRARRPIKSTAVGNHTLTKVVRHKAVYQVSVAVTPSAQECNSIVIMANDMTAPYTTAAGSAPNQPKWYDEMSNQYNHYNVLKSSVSVQNISQHGSVYWGARTTDRSGGDLAGKSLGEVMTSSGVKAKFIPPYQADNPMIANSGNMRARAGFNQKKMFGPLAAGNTDLIGTGQQTTTNQGTGPTEKVGFEIFAVPTVNSTSNESLVYTFVVTINYLVRWSERRYIAESNI